MPVKEYAGVPVEVDDEGYLLDSSVWTREIASEIAVGEGIADLSENHWNVIEFMRKEFAENGTAPSIRRLKHTGVAPTKELYAMFPGGPAKKASKIAGLPKPKGCV